MTTTTLDLDHMRDLTERYSRYSRGAGGLSLMIGGLLLAASFLASACLPLTPALRVALVAFPAIWLLSKELLRRLYYQRDGAVLQQVSPKLRKERRWMTIYLFIVCGLIAAFVVTALAMAFNNEGTVPPAQLLAYLGLVTALPFAAMRWFWSIGDFLIGVLLFMQAALVAGGGGYDGPWWVLYAIGCAAYAIAVGVVEHRAYLKIRASLHGTPQA